MYFYLLVCSPLSSIPFSIVHHLQIYGNMRGKNYALPLYCKYAADAALAKIYIYTYNF